MKFLLTLTMLVSLVGAMFPAVATAQTGDPCAEALAAANSGASWYGDYEIVWGTGGSGSQVVLGTDGDDWLDGGGGHDILCGFGGDDTLIGGSGNDYLDAGTGINELYGGSGSDTLIGVVGDIFDGGSGANEVIANEPVLTPCELANTYDYNAGITPNLSGLDLSGCESNVNFRFADLSYANLTGAVLRNSGAIDSDFTGANFSGATLESYSFIRTNLTGANMSNINWSHGSMLASNLTGVTFANTSFTYVTFGGVDLTGVDFTGATFFGVSWVDVTCPDGTYIGYEGGTCEGHLTPAV